MRKILFLIIFVISAVAAVSGQEVVYEGRLTDMDSGDDLSGVTVSAVANGSVVYSTSTGRRGNYLVKLPVGTEYIVKYEKNGYVTKVMLVNVSGVNEEDLPIGGKIMPPVDIDLFKNRESVDFSFLEQEPVVEWDYDERKMLMDWDRQVYNRMKKKIEDKLAEAEQKEKQSDAKYNSLITEADKLFTAQDYEGALSKYEEAISIPGKEMEEHPNNRILEIEELRQAQAEKELAEQQSNAEYQNLIDAADNLASSKDYEAAIAKYEEASLLKPEEQYPKDQILALQAEKDKAEKMEEYTTLIKRADGFFDQNSLKVARDIYQEASKLIPSEQYPKDQLVRIQEKLDAQKEQREQKQKYDDAIAKANEFYDAEEYEQAIAKYEEAISYESAATYPKERIDMAKAALEELKAAAEEEEQFNNLVKEADELVVAGDYEQAIAKYDEALTIKTDGETETKKQKAQDLLDESIADQEKQKQIEELLVSAAEKMSASSFEEALTDYTAVLSLDQNNVKAIEGKAAVEKAITQQKALAEKKEQFDQLVDEGDQAFSADDWETAKLKYEAAMDIFEEDQHVKYQLAKIEEELRNLREQQQINEQIQSLLDEAENLKSDEKWKQVIDKYEEALNLDEDRDDVKTLLEEAKLSFENWKKEQSQQEQFETLKLEGDQLFAQEKWEDAKSIYQEALAIQEDEEIDQQIDRINEKLEELAANKEVEERFNELVEAAEKSAEEGDLEKAVSKYEEALIVKSSADVENEIARLKDEIENLKNKEAKQAEYEAAIKAGKEALANEDYASAVKSFEDALLAIPMDSEATRLKREAQKALDHLRGEEEKYNDLLADAQAAFDNNKLEAAKLSYEEAQSMRPKATLPQDRIIEIDELLRKRREEQAEQQQKDQLYQEKIELANVAVGNFKYQNAIDHLNEALKIKPDEDFPKKKIKEYQALLDQIAAQNSKEKKYDEFIDKADLAFDNGDYEESIGLYEEALSVKPSEPYPSAQIIKAEEAIKNLVERDKNRVYNDLVEKGDELFTSEQYEDALEKYKEAMVKKPGDQYASNKIEETQQIIENRAKELAQDQENNKAYNEAIRQADELFNTEQFIKAKEAYELALRSKPNDTYAIERVQESVAKAKAKVDAGDETRYQKILTKADEYFDEENWEKAISLYNRARKLRSYDQYPKDKLAEIKAIQNGNIKKDKGLDYLGEKENISIIEGQALLEEAENLREQLKQNEVEQRIVKNEGQAIDRQIVDSEDRAEYENEILRINQLRNELIRVEKSDKDDIVVKLDQQEYQFEQLHIQENVFERGEVLRENQNVTYIADAYTEHLRTKSEEFNGEIERVKRIEVAKEELDRAELIKEKSAVLNTSDQLVEIEDERREDTKRAIEMRKDNEFKIDQLEQDQERTVRIESNDEYEEIKRMESEALLAELSVDKMSKEKQIIHDQLQEDIKRLEGNLTDKERKETREIYEEQLVVDANLTAAQELYVEAKEDNDDARMDAVEKLKRVEQDKELELKGRNEREQIEGQDNIAYAESIKDKEQEAYSAHRNDKVEISEKLNDRIIESERDENRRSAQEKLERESATDEIERIQVNEEQTHTEKSEKVKENDEKVKAVEATLQAGDRTRKEALVNDKRKAQELLDKMEVNKLTFTPDIANTLGDEFPEGVTQETYVRRDKNDIPIKIVTRRIVVTDGYGEVFMRIQTRNGVTYSQNGRPISEAAWIRGTEDANLVQHF